MQDSEDVNTRVILLRIFQAYLLIVLSKFVFASFLLFLQNRGFISEVARATSERTLSSDLLTFYFLLEVAVAGPIMEELAFRGIILKNHRTVVISLVFLLYILIGRFTGSNFYAVSMETSLILVLSALFVFLFNVPISRFIISVTGKNRSGTILISSVCFALWHYYNFDFSKANVLEIGLNLFPHFISGIIFAVIALRYGIQWSILLHIMNNTIPVLAVMLS